MPRGTHGNHASGAKHFRWNSARVISSHGYVKIRVGRRHPLADQNGYAYEHRLIVASAGIVVPRGHVVHHRNGDKADNRLENLEIVSRGEHNAHHNEERGRDSFGRFEARR